MNKTKQYSELRKKYESGQLSDSDYILFATNLKLERVRSATNTVAWIVMIQFLIGVIAAFAILG